MSDSHSTDSEPVVAVVRRIAAPREVVFSYLIDPDRFVLWMGMGAELEPRPGGALQIRVSPDDVASGHYQVVDPPHRLVFTWGWQGDADVPPGSSTVEVLLTDEGGATLLELRHSGLPREESRHTHSAGWVRFLDRLAQVAQFSEL